MEKVEKFIELFRKGEVSREAIHDYIDEWHNTEANMPLHTFLGMTYEEYMEFVMKDTIF